MKILVVEDTLPLQEVIVATLEKERYIVETAADYKTALQKIEDYVYDCILLDIMLPDGNGLSLLEELKQMGKRNSVIIISAKDSLDDKIAGLDMGADDYLAKPFHLAELVARVRTVIRRNQNQGDLTIKIENIVVYPDDFRVEIDGATIDLNRKEYDILIYFINRINRLIDKNTLAESVWGDHIDQVDNFDFIYAQIKNLRKKLHDANAQVEIKAVYGLGYKMTISQ